MKSKNPYKIRHPSWLGIVFLLASFFFLKGEAIEVKTTQGFIASSTTLLDEWQSSFTVGVFEVEDIFIGPKHKIKMPYDIFAYVQTHKDFITYKDIYKKGQTYEIKPKLLKLKILKIWKEKELIKHDQFIYILSFPITDSLKIGDRVLLELDKQSYTGSQHYYSIGYNMRIFEKYTGGPFYYFTTQSIYPPLLLLKNRKNEEFVSGCIDGLTKIPLNNPLLSDLEKYVLPVINQAPQTKFVGLFGATDTTREVFQCGPWSYWDLLDLLFDFFSISKR